MGERPGELVGAHSALLVCVDDGRRAQAEQAERAIDRRVPLGADEHARGQRPGALTLDVPPDGVEDVEARGREPGRVCHLGAGDEADRPLTRQAEQVEDPLARDLLDDRRRRSSDVQARVLVPALVSQSAARAPVAARPR